MNCSGLLTHSSAPVEIAFNGTISSIMPGILAEHRDVFVAPGFIDLQVNGYAGVDYNSPVAPHEEIARSIREMYAAGVTRFYPTVITGSEEDMTGAMRNLAAARESLPEGAAMEGFHIEGPHISPEDGPRGAHPERWVRPPDIEEFRRWQDASRGLIRLVTLAPEWPEAPRYIETLAAEGIILSIGHTGATPEQVQAAVDAGATMSTHLGNGAHFTIRRHPNYIWEQLAEDRLAASFIVDGIHLPASFVKVAIRGKGLDLSVLVTDAVMPAGCQPGPYNLGEVEVELLPPGDRVVVRGSDRLAGSALRMDRGVENLMKFAGLSVGEAVQMATLNPARVAGITGRQKGIAPGERSDFVRFRYTPANQRIEVLETILDGKAVFQA
jgi:N-acetylglucosamine-6-phosphate deacetylase